MTWQIIAGDCLSLLREIPDRSADSIVTDPPAGISFMGKAWDSDKGGRDQWIAWLSEIMAECLRVLKPGAHMACWAIPRTSHWTAMAIEDAGFEIRDVVTHIFGSGFPKSLNVSKGIDKKFGAEREVVGERKFADGKTRPRGSSVNAYGESTQTSIETAPSTDLAKKWDGFGTGLKPASEHYIIARKPLTGTIVNNVLEHGTGALNIDGCRISHHNTLDLEKHKRMVERLQEHGGSLGESWKNSSDLSGASDVSTLGRWPANLTLDEEAAAMVDEQSGERKGMSGGGKHKAGYGGGLFGGIDCEHTARNDTGGASRFFYTAKPSAREREAGCDALPKRSASEMTDRDEDTAGINNLRAGSGRTSNGRANHHPTVKPIALMRWLCRLVTPPGGLIVDPFAGSGSTGCAAVQEGFRFVGCELDPEYVEIARARIAHWEAAK